MNYYVVSTRSFSTRKKVSHGFDYYIEAMYHADVMMDRLNGEYYSGPDNKFNMDDFDFIEQHGGLTRRVRDLGSVTISRM